MVTAAVVETQKAAKLKTTLKLHFKFDYMTVVLYSHSGNEVCGKLVASLMEMLWQRLLLSMKK